MGKRGPKPQGEAVLTLAERQARYRAARQAGTPAVRYRKPGDRRSRPQRWKDAVTELVELQADGAPRGRSRPATPTSWCCRTGRLRRARSAGAALRAVVQTVTGSLPEKPLLSSS